ncbi:MAG: hypothetical protein ACSHX9_00360 [Luteolibacter sp.]
MSKSPTIKTPAKPKLAEGSGDQSLTQEFISRGNLAKRWDISIEFIKHKERAGDLKPVKLGYRSIAYSLRDVIELEKSMSC